MSRVACVCSSPGVKRMLAHVIGRQVSLLIELTGNHPLLEFDNLRSIRICGSLQPPQLIRTAFLLRFSRVTVNARQVNVSAASPVQLGPSGSLLWLSSASVRRNSFAEGSN